LSHILQIQDLHGGYLPGKYVLKQIDFSVKEGEMVGLIGLNGAGKSTTIKHILGLMQPQRGDILIRGKKIEDGASEYRSSFAYVPESPELYEELTVWEHLELTAMAYGIPQDVFRARAERLLEEFRMAEKSRSFPSQLSKGMKQKVMIMNAFLIEPPLYVIDEPFLGLDPLAMRSLLETMAGLRREGAAFLISSHILSTIERYCDRFVILHHGEIRAQGTLEELRRNAGCADDESVTLDDLFYRYVTE